MSIPTLAATDPPQPAKACPPLTTTVGVAGIGGFAATHHRSLWELEQAGHLRVVAAVDPKVHQLAEICRSFEFGAREVQILDSFEELLEHDCDWVSVATPINLHLSMHAACVERRRPCYLEKPPTLDPLELDLMIKRDAQAVKQTQVGFLYTYEPARHHLKKRLLSGEFGRLRQVTLMGAWQRSERYYARNHWAGKLMLGDSLILDSCLGNAMAHHVNNLLFFAGNQGSNSWGACRELEARMYRANRIEGADTVFLRARVDNEIEMRLALTHACEADFFTEEKLICDRAVITITPDATIRVEAMDEPVDQVTLPPWDGLKHNLRLYSDYVHGKPTRLLGTLEHCVPFVNLNALAYISTGEIRPVAPRLLRQEVDPASGLPRWIIPGIEARLREFVQTGDFKAAAELSGHRAESRIVGEQDLPRLRSHIEGMRGAKH